MLAAAGRAASVWSAAIWMYLQQYCSNCEKIKNLQANLDSHCIFCIFEDSTLKPDSGEGCCCAAQEHLRHCQTPGIAAGPQGTAPRKRSAGPLYPVHRASPVSAGGGTRSLSRALRHPGSPARNDRRGHFRSCHPWGQGRCQEVISTRSCPQQCHWGFRCPMAWLDLAVRPPQHHKGLHLTLAQSFQLLQSPQQTENEANMPKNAASTHLCPRVCPAPAPREAAATSLCLQWVKDRCQGVAAESPY